MLFFCGVQGGADRGLCWRAGGPRGSAEDREASEPASVPRSQPVQRNPDSCVTGRHFYQRPSCVCVCAHMCADVCEHTSVPVFACTHGHTCVCVGMYLCASCAHLCVNVQPWKHNYAGTGEHTHVPCSVSTHMFTRAHAHTYTRLCVAVMQVYVFVCHYVNTCLKSAVCADMYLCTRMHVCMCVYAHMCLYMCACVHVYECVNLCPCMHAHVWEHSCSPGPSES